MEFPKDNPQIDAVRLTQANAVDEAGEQFTGHLIWDDDCTTPIYSPVSGRVEKIYAEVGQKVAPGDELAIMHSPDFAQAQADYDKALSALSQTEKALGRLKRLIEHGAAAQKDVESAQGDRDRALAEKQRAELTLKKLSEKLQGNFSDLYHVRSPLAGVVVDKKINIGQEVRPDIILSGITQLAVTPLFRISDPTRLWVQFDVSEARIGQLKAGMEIVIRTPAYPGRPFAGKIIVVGASLDPNSRTAYARATVVNPAGLLKEEMYVTVNLALPTQKQQSVQVPSRAVLFIDGKYYVFVRTGPRSFERREVGVEHEAGSGGIVLSGLQADQWVVTEGALLLNDLLSA